MKKMFTKKPSVLKLSALTGFFVGSLLLTNLSYGQTYYSKFANTAGHYGNTNPADCDAPAIQNIEGIADKDDSSHAYFTATDLAEDYTCSNRYLFNADLNMADGPNAVSPGGQAGFKIRVKPGTTADSLGYFLTVTTYLRDSLNPESVSFQEYATGGGSSGINLKGIALDNNNSNTSSNWFVYFTSTKPFNLVELAVNPQIIATDTAFEFDAFYAFGGALEKIFPAQIANFKASVSGKNVNLSWQSLTETNVSNYRIERSSNGGVSYSAIAAVPAKGNSNSTISYAYSDAISLNGNYLYRVVTVNKDGSSKATNSIAAVISGQGKLLLYPTVVKAGQSVTVKTSETGLVSVYMYDAQGRLVKQQRTSSTGQFSISTTGLSAGVYNIKLISASGSVLQSKIIVN